MSGEQVVQTSITDRVAHVRLNRPDKHNAIDAALMSGLIDTAAGIGSDTDVRAVVLSGNGPSFCSGLDMANFGAMASGDLHADSDRVQEAYADLSAEGANRAQQVGWAWHELPIPVIAAVHGNALGGGLNLALAADIRITTPQASLGFVEITWGLMPDMSASQALRRLVGADKAKRLMLTGERVPGTTALEWGLATEVSEQPVERALELAATIVGHSPDAVRAIKAVIDRIVDLDTRAGLALESSRSAALLGSPNQVEAVAARLGGRRADFRPPTDGHR